MKRNVIFGAIVLLAGSLLAAESDDIKSAAKKLGEASSYGWKTSVVVPEGGGGGRFRPGPSEGKTQKDGFTHVTMTFGEGTSEAVLKGDKGAIKTADTGWQSVSEAAEAEGPERFLALRVRSLKTPAVEAAELAAQTKALKKDGDAYSGELTDEGAKTLLSFRPRTGGEGPTISNAKGSIKFWIKDGALSKYEHKVQGTVSFNGNDREVDRTTTVEIKDVGTTKVEVPEEAMKKLT